MKKKESDKRNVMTNFEIFNEGEFGITIIGDPTKIDSYPVMNLRNNFVRNFWTGQTLKVDIDEYQKTMIEEKLARLPKTDEVSVFKIIIKDCGEFNNILKSYRVPSNIIPHSLGDGAVVIPFYKMTAPPSKFVIKMITIIKDEKGIIKDSIPSSTPYIRGIPKDKIFDKSIFDREIQLDRTSVVALLTKGILDIKERMRAI